MKALVVDKSFAQAISASKMKQLAESRAVLVPSVFVWEIFSTAPKKRVSTIAGMKSFRWIHLPNLLESERSLRKPSSHSKVPCLSFNEYLLDPQWRMGSLEKDILKEYEDSHLRPGLEFWQEVISTRSVPVFTDKEIDSASNGEDVFLKLCKTLNSQEKIREVAELISSPLAGLLEKHWFTFRHIQALVLHGLVLLQRYRASSTDTPNKERLEHDMNDLEYLSLGLHCGSLATGDFSPKKSKRSMAWRFHLLEPNGELLTPQSFR